MADERTPRLGLPLLHAGQAQKEIAHNEALAALDALVQAQAVSADVAEPPESPEAGQCWIVATGATGGWASKDGALALWTEGGWRFPAPPAGARVTVADRGHAMIADGAGAWSDAPDRPDGYHVAGQRVIGPRAGAVADPVGGAVVDVEARAAIVAILDALRGHGSIAAS